MLWTIIFVLLGVAGEIVKANGWFIIPDFITYILFGMAIIMVIISFVNYRSVKKEFKRFR